MSRLGGEARLILVAVQFLTRLPVPPGLPFAPDAPVRAARWFPLVGHLVGAICAGVWLATGRVWPAPVAALLAVGAGVLVTGAFHEDGLADTADGLGGGGTPERRLAIMKDSRIGTYGALALALGLALRVSALAGLSPEGGALALLVAHGAARGAAVVVMAATPYAGDPAAAKGRAPARTGVENALFAAVLGFAPLALLPWRAAVLGALLAAVFAAWLVRAAVKLVGGHTGDVLGAVEQVVEAAVLLGVAGAG